MDRNRYQVHLLEDYHDLLDTTQEDHSPSTVTTALPTPYEYLTGPDQTQWPPPHIYTPAAPAIKDLDSFTDGTGSFDCLSEITTPGDLCAHPPTTLLEQNVSQLGAEDHMQSIALWREDVHLELDVDVVEDPHSQPTSVRLMVVDINTHTTPISKRPRSVVSTDDGRKRIRVKAASTSSPQTLHLELRPITRRTRTISAPPIFIGSSSSTLS